MKIIVTGAGGYLAKNYLSIYKEADGFVALSRNIDSTGQINGVHYFNSDYSYEKLIDVFDGCDAVVHLAYAMATKENESIGLPAYKSSMEMTKNVLDAAHKTGITNIVFASSRLVYPNHSETPFGENDEICPSNNYAVSKVKMENLCKRYSEEYGMKIKILRFGQIIGPKTNVKGLFSTFIERASSNEPLNLIGNNIRDYIYIKDACRGIDCAIHHPEKSGAYNISMGHGIDNRKMADEIKSALNSSSEITCSDNSDYNKGDKIVLDCSKSVEELGFYCRYDTIKKIVTDMICDNEIGTAAKGSAQNE